jgi:hypothetical protein
LVDGDVLLSSYLSSVALLEEQGGLKFNNKKSRIRETKHLSTDAGSSTDAIGGWTENTQRPDFFEKRKKLQKTQKLRNF